MRSKTALVLVTVVAVVAAGCGSSSNNQSSSGSASSGGGVAFKVPTRPVQSSVGPGEGKLSVICWAGYCEDGSTDPKVDWVKPFEKQTGCQTTARVANTAGERG